MTISERREVGRRIDAKALLDHEVARLRDGQDRGRPRHLRRDRRVVGLRLERRAAAHVDRLGPARAAVGRGDPQIVSMFGGV
jgi:hypothetical protein